MSCRIQAVEHRCAAGLACTHSGLQDRILLNFTRTENGHKECKKTLIFYMYIEVQQTFTVVFFFPCWGIIKCLNASVSTTVIFELVQQFYHAAETGNAASGQRERWSAIAKEIKTSVLDKVTYRETILNMRNERKICKEWWDGSWMQTITQILRNRTFRSGRFGLSRFGQTMKSCRNLTLMQST